jgi:hypothetical protein
VVGSGRLRAVGRGGGSSSGVAGCAGTARAQKTNVQVEGLQLVVAASEAAGRAQPQTEETVAGGHKKRVERQPAAAAQQGRQQLGCLQLMSVWSLEFGCWMSVVG